MTCKDCEGARKEIEKLTGYLCEDDKLMQGILKETNNLRAEIMELKKQISRLTTAMST